MTKARYMVIIVFVGWRENYFKMLLWLSRQSTSLVRTRSPVRIWLTAPCNPNTLDAMRKNRMASVFSKDFEDKILYCKRRKREGTRPNFLLSPIFRSSIVFCSLFSLDISALYLVFIKRGSYNLVTVRARFLSGYSGVGALPLWFAFLPALQGGVAIWQAVQDLPGDIFSYTVFSKRKESIPFPCATMWTTSCSPTQSAWYMWNWASFREK